MMNAARVARGAASSRSATVGRAAVARPLALRSPVAARARRRRTRRAPRLRPAARPLRPAAPAIVLRAAAPAADPPVPARAVRHVRPAPAVSLRAVPTLLRLATLRRRPLRKLLSRRKNPAPKRLRRPQPEAADSRAEASPTAGCGWVFVCADERAMRVRSRGGRVRRASIGRRGGARAPACRAPVRSAVGRCRWYPHRLIPQAPVRDAGWNAGSAGPA